MYKIKVQWLSYKDGGRKSIMPCGWYYPIARFEDYDQKDPDTWSVKLNLGFPYWENDQLVSKGFGAFLVDQAPNEKMKEFNKYDIYEGPKKVGTTYIGDVVHNLNEKFIFEAEIMTSSN